MTNEDKKLISDYMKWNYSEALGIYYYDSEGIEQRYLDLNDAGLCVQEMQKRGDWQKCCATGFGIYFESERPSHVFPEDYIAWLFNAENFFSAMSEWLKERG
jgi:hypothetical protein